MYTPFAINSPPSLRLFHWIWQRPVSLNSFTRVRTFWPGKPVAVAEAVAEKNSHLF
jgi:hypothetical protein